eukprot:TRINITY_DN23832_c0_g2_i7.p1 TRINITY_DN23832_c0_g2~~TRINITY_DN23832_c0_g2_i7.p1  ORF type:complete len:1200 (+),score=235.75 TRINITY_DN23832_c0_g2_i7:161-3760(+)
MSLSVRSFVYTNGNQYSGQYIVGGPEGKIPHGRGLYNWKDGSNYEGDFQNGQRHGFGVYLFPNGDRFEGEFASDVQVRGRLVSGFTNKTKIQGEFLPDGTFAPDPFDYDATRSIGAASAARALASQAPEHVPDKPHASGAAPETKPGLSDQFNGNPFGSEQGMPVSTNPFGSGSAQDSTWGVAPGSVAPCQSEPCPSSPFQEETDKETLSSSTLCPNNPFDIEDTPSSIVDTPSSVSCANPPERWTKKPSSESSESSGVPIPADLQASSNHQSAFVAPQIPAPAAVQPQASTSTSEDKQKLGVLKKAYLKLQEDQAELKRQFDTASQQKDSSSVSSVELDALREELEAARLAERRVRESSQDEIRMLRSACDRMEAELDTLKAAPTCTPDTFGVSEMRRGLGRLFDSEAHSDVQYLVEGKRLWAHRAVLSMFESGLSADWDGHEPGSTCELVVPRTSYKVFRGMLEWIYCDRTEFDSEDMVELLELCHKYQLVTLEKHCETSLIQQIGPQNVCQFLSRADKLNSDLLKAHCTDFIQAEYHQVLQTGTLGSLSAAIARELFETISIDPLHSAIQNERVDVVMLMLYSDVDINAPSSTGTLPIETALECNTLATAARLVKLSADVNLALNSHQGSLLLKFAHQGNESAVSFLMSHGAKKEVCNEEGYTALDVACLNGHDGVLHAMLQAKCKSRYLDSDGNSILHLACAANDEAKVVLAMDAVEHVSIANNHGQTALHIAASVGGAAAVFHLIDRGCLADGTDDRGWTPLRHALWNGHTEVGSILCEVGANVNLASEEEGEEGDTMLHLACAKGMEEIGLFLISHNANVNARSVLGQYPVDVFCSNRKMYMDDSLLIGMLEKGGCSSFVDERGNTLLHLAAMRGSERQVELILSNSQTEDLGSARAVGLMNEAMEQPLHVAAQHGHYKVVSCLLNNRADPNARDRLGRTALHMGTPYQNICVLLLSPDNNLEVNPKDNGGCTPLMLAVNSDKAKKTCNLLIEQGADVNATNNAGQSALHYAVMSPGPEQADVASILIETGGIVSCADAEGNTPLHYAAGVVHDQFMSEELAVRLVLAGASLACPNLNGFSALDAKIALETRLPEAEQLVLHIQRRMLENVIHTPVWLQDHATNNCQMCRAVFGRLRTRKHHCRMCGRIVCKQCSEFKRPISKLNCQEAVRVCNMCNQILESDQMKGEKVFTP